MQKTFKIGTNARQEVSFAEFNKAVTRSRNEYVSFVNARPKYREAMVQLLDSGADLNCLTDLAHVNIIFAKNAADRSRKKKGKPRYNRQTFVTRVREIAQQIESANRAQLWAGGISDFMGQVLDHAEKEWIFDLPEQLRSYANIIEKVGKGLSKKGRPRGADTTERLALLKYVQRVTGNPHYPQVALLLTAANECLGNDSVVHADGLKNLSARVR
jgi:hypothetical protein